MYVGNNFFQVLSGIGCPLRAGVLVVCQFCFGGGKNGTFLVAETKPVMSPD